MGLLFVLLITVALHGSAAKESMNCGNNCYDPFDNNTKIFVCRQMKMPPSLFVCFFLQLLAGICIGTLNSPVSLFVRLSTKKAGKSPRGKDLK